MKSLKMVFVGLCFLGTSALASNSLAWTISSDFNQGVTGARAQGASGFSYAGTKTLFSSDIAKEGTKSAKVSWSSGEDGWGTAMGQINYPTLLGEGSEVWIRLYSYFKSPWPSSGLYRFPKFLRVAHVVNQSGGNVGYHSIYIDSDARLLQDSEIAGTQVKLGAAVTLDTWECYEMYVKFSSTSGIVRIWKNGILVGENKVSRTLRSSTDKAELAYIFSWWNNGAPQNATAYIDAVEATSSRPSNQDAAGNYMIGPIGLAPAPTTTPSAPVALGVQ